MTDWVRLPEPSTGGRLASALRRIHIDGPLLLGLVIIVAIGLAVLYSAVDQRWVLVRAQVIRLAIAFAAMFIVAQFSPAFMRRWTPAAYLGGLALLVLVIVIGDTGHGAQRWLEIGIRFQPSEVMKLAVPMLLAWYLHTEPLPPSLKTTALLAAAIAAPTALIAVQPDLGTSILIAASGALVLLLAGLRLRIVLAALALLAAALPLIWRGMHDYQRQRVLTLLDPTSDPLGAGYNIIQSTIAIGSGGLFGRGWTNGTQGTLGYLPERNTDFIFAVLAEEFGLLGVVALLLAYLFVVGRGLYIALVARDTFARLTAGSISLTFFVYVFVNIGMVSGILPVVGVPLPLVSFGGTSMVTLLAGFGILMSIHTRRKLLPH
ncbi:MAG: rod shape-determining protein RodA [Pseudomonadota bacterium]